ncbi:unnamed protein product, partial [Brassica rapa]
MQPATRNCIFSSSASHLELPATKLSGIFFKKKCMILRGSALKFLGDLTHIYFVGNAPMAHMAIQPTEETPDLPSYKRFLFRCSVVAASKYKISNCEDFSKDELLAFFPEHAEFFNNTIVS